MFLVEPVNPENSHIATCMLDNTRWCVSDHCSTLLNEAEYITTLTNYLQGNKFVHCFALFLIDHQISLPNIRPCTHTFVCLCVWQLFLSKALRIYFPFWVSFPRACTSKEFCGLIMKKWDNLEIFLFEFFYGNQFWLVMAFDTLSTQECWV